MDPFEVILVSFWDRFVIILEVFGDCSGNRSRSFFGSPGVATGVDPPMLLGLSLEALGGLTPLKYAQMFVVGAAAALGGVNPPHTATDIWGG